MGAVKGEGAAKGEGTLEGVGAAEGAGVGGAQQRARVPAGEHSGSGMEWEGRGEVFIFIFKKIDLDHPI